MPSHEIHVGCPWRFASALRWRSRCNPAESTVRLFGLSTVRSLRRRQRVLRCAARFTTLHCACRLSWEGACYGALVGRCLVVLLGMAAARTSC